MKRVLLVAYYFPPQPKAGSLRASYLSTHLREFGWEPTVLTTTFPGQDLANGRAIATADFGPDAAQKTAAVKAGDGQHAASPRVRSRAGEALRAAVKTSYFPDNRRLAADGSATGSRLVRAADCAVLSTAPLFTGQPRARGRRHAGPMDRGLS